MPFSKYFSLLACIFLMPLTAVAGQNLSSDHLQGLPEVKAPKAGSLQGSLSKFNPAVSELSQGSLSIPLAMGVDQSRGPLLVNPFPSYSIHNGLSEWGQGLEVMLDIHRHREIGDVNFIDDDFVSPWGVLVKGNDGSWYPKGLKAAVKVDISDTGAKAVLADGTIWNFTKAIPSTNPAVPYGFVLTEVTSLVGDRTLLSWQEGTRPLLSEIRYGSRNPSVFPYSIRLNYEALPKDNLTYSYRSKRLAQITNRVQSVQFFDLSFSTVKARWVYTLSHEYSSYSPAFYLKSYQKTYASGAMEPAIQLKWSRFDDFIKGVKPAPTARLDGIVQKVNVGAISSRGLSFFDFDNDGLVDIETAKDYRLYRQTTNGFEEIADHDASSNWQPCLPPDAIGRDARRIVRLNGPYGRPVVFMNLIGSGSAVTRLMACELNGQVVYDENFNVDFSENALVSLGDLNGDQRPDLVKFTPSSIEVLENISTESQIKFRPRASFPLDVGSLETNLSVADINGDGIPDLFNHEGSSGRTYFGKGNFEFTKKYTILPYHDAKDQSYDVGAKAAVNFVDANGDGLTDLAISNGREFYLMMNMGLRFKAAPIPFTEGLGNEGEALTVNILASGSPMVFRSSGSKDVRGMELSGPDVGLLKSVDDGQGNLVSFEFSWQKPENASMQLQKQLTKITRQSLGKGITTLDLEYGKSRLGSKKPYLLGYDSIKQRSPLLESIADFQNPEESPGLLRSMTQKDLTGSILEKISSSDFISNVIRGITVWQKKSESVFSRSGTSVSDSSLKTFQYKADSLCMGTETLKLGADSLTTSFDYAEIAGIEPGLGCPLTAVERHGRHGRKDFDFDESLTITLNSLGQPENISQQRPDGVKVLQQIRYDALNRMNQLKTLSGLSYSVGYHGDSVMIDFVETSIGVRNEVLERTEAGLTQVMATKRGSDSILQETFIYDDFERLKDRSDNASGDLTLPIESIAYTFGSKSSPAFIRTTKRSSESAAAIRDEYFAAGGDVIARIRALESGRVIENLASFDAASGYSASHARALTDGDFASTWQSLQASVSKKSEQFSDGFGGQKDAALTHEQSVIEKISGRPLIEENLLTTIRVSNGRFRTKAQMDALGRITGKMDEAGNWTRFLHDMQGRLREVVLADGTRQTAVFDNFGRIARIERTSLGSIEYLYNDRDLMQDKNFRLPDGTIYRSINFAYDIHGRVVKKVSSSGGNEQAISFYYDGFTSTPEFYPNQKGLMTAIKGNHFETRRIHDQKARPVREIKTLQKGGIRQEMSLAYHADDTISSSDTTVTVNGAADRRTLLENIPSPDGLLKEIRLNGEPLAVLSYDKLGQIESADLGQGKWVVSFTKDPITGALSGYSADGKSHEATYSLHKNTRGNIVKESFNGQEKIYGYDDRSFLTSVTGGAGDEVFGYDLIGLMAPAADTVRGLEYDPAGRLRQKGGMLLSYDGQGQIASARMDNDAVIGYGYDENELRNLKTKNGEFHSARLGDNVITKDHVLEPLKIGGIIVGFLDNGAFKPLLGDLRGTVFDDGSKSQIATAYGQRASQEIWQSMVDYGGHSRDEDTGLIRMGVRDYDGGKFIQPDPLFMENLEKCLESTVECSLYGYAKNNPISGIDPSGKLTIIIHGTWAKEAEWAQPDSEFATAVGKTFGEKPIPHNWEAGNNRGDRADAAKGLLDMISKYTFSPGEKLNIVAHSHGGNVVKLYTKLAGSRPIDNLVLMGTPHRDDYGMNITKVGNLVNAYSDSDGVQLGGGTDASRIGRGYRGAYLMTSKNERIPVGNNIRLEGTEGGDPFTSPLISHSNTHSKESWEQIEQHLSK